MLIGMFMWVDIGYALRPPLLFDRENVKALQETIEPGKTLTPKESKLILLLFGAPGVGKGTAAELLKKKYNLPHIATGDLLREAVKAGSSLGEKVKDIMASGGLVPDPVMIELVEERVQRNDCKNGFILDGFPRTANQAEALDSLLESLKIGISVVFNITVESDEFILDRISGRRICRSCGKIWHLKNIPPPSENTCSCGGELYQRKDDNPDVMRQRLKTYREETESVLSFYGGKGLLVDVMAEGEPKIWCGPITEKIDAILQSFPNPLRKIKADEIEFIGIDEGKLTAVKEAIFEGHECFAKWDRYGGQEERFIEPQARILRYLNSRDVRGIPRVLDFVETEDGKKIILFEKFPQGMTLGVKVASLSMEETVDIMLKVTRVVKSLLDQGVYHWDIKPFNIWVTDQGEVILFDFDTAFMAKDEVMDR